MSLARGSHTPTLLAQHQSPHFGGFTATTTDLYWTSGCLAGTSGLGAVMAVAPSGTVSTIASREATPIALAVGGPHLLYWTTTGEALVRWAAGGNPTTVVSGNFGVGVAADAYAAYVFASTPHLGTSALVRIVPQ